MAITRQRRKDIEDAYFKRGVPIYRIAEAHGLSQNLVRKILEGWV